MRERALRARQRPRARDRARARGRADRADRPGGGRPAAGARGSRVRAVIPTGHPCVGMDVDPARPRVLAVGDDGVARLYRLDTGELPRSGIRPVRAGRLVVHSRAAGLVPIAGLAPESRSTRRPVHRRSAPVQTRSRGACRRSAPGRLRSRARDVTPSARRSCSGRASRGRRVDSRSRPRRGGPRQASARQVDRVASFSPERADALVSAASDRASRASGTRRGVWSRDARMRARRSGARRIDRATCVATGAPTDGPRVARTRRTLLTTLFGHNANVDDARSRPRRRPRDGQQRRHREDMAGGRRPARMLVGHTARCGRAVRGRRSVVTGGADGTIRVWDPARASISSGRTSRAERPPRRGGLAGRQRASRADGRRRPPPTPGATGECLQGHKDAVNSVAFSPDGRLLVSAGAGPRRDRSGTSRPARRRLRIEEAQSGSVADARFSPDGRWLVTAGPIVGATVDGRRQPSRYLGRAQRPRPARAPSASSPTRARSSRASGRDRAPLGAALRRCSTNCSTSPKRACARREGSSHDEERATSLTARRARDEREGGVRRPRRPRAPLPPSRESRSVG